MKAHIMAVAAGALLLILALTGVFRRHHGAAPPPGPAASEESPRREASEPELPPRVSLLPFSAVPSAAAPSNSPPNSGTNWLHRLIADDFAATELPRDVIDRWLASDRTNAEDLLAARQAGGGDEFLRTLRVEEGLWAQLGPACG